MNGNDKKPELEPRTSSKPDTGDDGIESLKGEGDWLSFIKKALTSPFLSLLQRHVKAMTIPNRKSPEAALAEYTERHPRIYRMAIFGDTLSLLIFLTMAIIATGRALGVDLFIKYLLNL